MLDSSRPIKSGSNTEYVKLLQVGDKVRLSVIGKEIFHRDHPRSPHNGLGVIAGIRDGNLWGYSCIKVNWGVKFYNIFASRELELVL